MYFLVILLFAVSVSSYSQRGLHNAFVQQQVVMEAICVQQMTADKLRQEQNDMLALLRDKDEIIRERETTIRRLRETSRSLNTTIQKMTEEIQSLQPVVEHLKGGLPRCMMGL